MLMSNNLCHRNGQAVITATPPLQLDSSDDAIHITDSDTV